MDDAIVQERISMKNGSQVYHPCKQRLKELGGWGTCYLRCNDDSCSFQPTPLVPGAWEIFESGPAIGSVSSDFTCELLCTSSTSST